MSRISNHLSSTQINILGAATILLSILLPTPLSILSANAVQMGNKQTLFHHAPQLIRAAATHNTPNTPSTYQFTIEVPEDAGSPLKAVTITQQPNVEDIDFDVSNSQAFMGTSIAKGESISIANIGGDVPTDVSEVTIEFEKPIAPGNTVTIALSVNRNPQFGGIYQFSVTAFPLDETSPGLYLGQGRIQLMSN